MKLFVFEGRTFHIEMYEFQYVTAGRRLTKNVAGGFTQEMILSVDLDLNVQEYTEFKQKKSVKRAKVQTYYVFPIVVRRLVVDDVFGDVCLHRC